jgi:hypothetical protein
MSRRWRPAGSESARWHSCRSLGILLGLMLVASACATSQAATQGPPSSQQDASQTCVAADAVVQQALAMHTNRLSQLEGSRATAMASTLRRLADAAEDDAVQERLSYTADAIQTLAAAIQAGDPSAVIGAREVVKGFARTCPVADPTLTQGPQRWVAASANSVLRSDPNGPLGSSALEISTLQAGSCGFQDAARAVSSTLPGVYRVRVWVRSPSGTRKVTANIEEWVGTTRVAQASATVTAGPSWKRLAVTLRPRAPTHSALSLAVSATTSKAGGCFFAGNVSVIWG